MNEQDLLFDTLTNNQEPTQIFGPIINSSQNKQIIRSIKEFAMDCRIKIKKTFSYEITNDLSGISHLDSIVKTMWATNWNPKTNNLGAIGVRS